MTTKTATATTAPAVTATATIKLLVGEKAIKAALVSIHRRGQSLQQDMHVAACSVLAHIEKHSDIRLISDLLTAMPESSRKNAMRDWFVKFGPVMFEGNDPVFVKGKTCDLKAAMATTFWALVPEPEYKPIEVASFIDGMIKKLVRDEKELGTANKHAALIASLAKLKPANVIAA